MSAAVSRSAIRSLLAASLPVAACGVQLLCWPIVAPAAWFFFYPTVFFSSWWGGRQAGLAATGLATLLVWWHFLPPVHVVAKPGLSPYLTAALFVVMGTLFSLFHERLRRATSRAAELEVLRTREAAASLLREQADLLDRMSRLAKVGGWSFDTRTLQGTWSPEVARIHDLDPSYQPNVRSGLDFYHQEDRPILARAVQEAVETGRPYDLELRLVTARGRLRWVHSICDPVMEGGRVVRVHGALQDTTARKEAELALRASEAGYRSIFEQAGAGVVEVDGATGRFLRVNARFCQFVGYSEAELLGRSFPELTFPADLAQDLLQTRRLASGDLQEYATEKRYLHKSGAIVWGALNARLLHREPGGACALVSIVLDITEHRRAQAELDRLHATLEQRVLDRTTELQAANQELESFAYAVSHDLRAPLRAMDGFSQALLDDCGAALTPEGKAHLGLIMAASRRMGGLIDGILRLSRASRCELVRVPVDLSALAEACLAELAGSEPARRVQWRVQPGLQAQGDFRLLEAAMVNLLGNAWKYTAGTPEARIDVAQVELGDRPWIRIRDNGCGFDMAYADKLFKPFQRLHRQDEFPGLGIGLATVQRIVQRHGGELTALGAPGHGADFYLFLPTPMPMPQPFQESA